MSSAVWFFVGVLTGSLVATAAVLLTVEWLLRRKR
ncbi:unknown [Dialister sp. CAG:486]|nr:unknown [Dialister sp. CAG:486]